MVKKMYKNSEKPSMSNPDKGKNGQQSGSMGSKYRGNNYNSIQDSIESSDKKKLNIKKY